MYTNRVGFMYHKYKVVNPTEEILPGYHGGIEGLRIFNKVTFISQSAQRNGHRTGKACLSTILFKRYKHSHDGSISCEHL